MIIRPSKIEGALVLTAEAKRDPRGYFARTFCEEELAAAGVDIHVAQSNLSHNHTRGTLRGLHFQAKPSREGKLVSCVRGAIYDVIVDLRPSSPTFLMWTAHILTEETLRMVWVPHGCAHGFQSLVDDTLVHYQMTEAYRPELSRGIRYDDPNIGVVWPVANPILSQRDYELPRFVASAA